MDAAGNITPWSGERHSFDDTPTLAPDGHRFVCSIANARGIDELWIGDVGSGRLRRLGTDPDADCTQPTWSPDGSRIAYKRQAQDARDGIYVQDVTGGTPRRILKPESSESTYRPQGWFPDGSALIVWRTLPGRSSIMRLPVTEAEVDSSRLQALHDARGNDRNPRLSPDGSMLAYVSDESGRNEVYVARFGAAGRLGPSVQVSSDGSFLCAWAPDGRTLQFTDFRNRLSDVAIPADPHADLAPRVRADLGKLDVASWTPLPGGRLLVGLRSEDEGEVSHYQLVLGFGDEVMRMLARSH
jgi:TolB protein